MNLLWIYAWLQLLATWDFCDMEKSRFWYRMLITEWCGIEELKSDEGWRFLQERRFGFRMASLSRYLWILTSQLKHHWRGTILSPQSTVNWWSTYHWFIILRISTAEIRCPRYGLKISGDRKYLDRFWTDFDGLKFQILRKIKSYCQSPNRLQKILSRYEKSNS